MGTKCTPLPLPHPHSVCLSNCWLCRIEAKLFTNKVPEYFNESEHKFILELLKRYMDDGFIFWRLKLNFENFKTCLNNAPINSRLKNQKSFMKTSKKDRF